MQLKICSVGAVQMLLGSPYALTTLLRQGDSRKIHFCSFGEKQKYMTMVQNSAEEKKMTLEREEFMNECE